MVIVAIGCKQKKIEEPAERTEVAPQVAETEVKGMVDEEGKAKGGTMDVVFSAESLYSCSMHPAVVTDNPEALCPECGMKLEKMSDEKVAELRASQPKGCPMCAMVVPGDSEMEKCPTCDMELKEIHKHEQGESEGQESGEM